MKTNLFKLLCTLLCVAMLVTAFPFAAVAEDTADGLYVSYTGSDETGDGTETNPYRTISKAQANLGSLSKIYIVDTTYSVTKGTKPENLVFYDAVSHTNTITYVGVSPDGKSGMGFAAGGGTLQINGPSVFENLTLVEGYGGWKLISLLNSGVNVTFDRVRVLPVRSGTTTQDTEPHRHDGMYLSQYGYWGKDVITFKNGDYGMISLSPSGNGGGDGNATITVNVENASMTSIDLTKDSYEGINSGRYNNMSYKSLFINLDNAEIINGIVQSGPVSVATIENLQVLAVNGTDLPAMSIDNAVITNKWFVKVNGGELTATGTPGTFTVPAGSTAYWYEKADTIKYATGTITLAKGTYDIKIVDSFSTELLPAPEAPEGFIFSGWSDDGEGTVKAVFEAKPDVNSVYLSTDGQIPGYSGTVHTTVASAIAELGSAGGTVYVEGSFTLPEELDVSAKELVTFKGYGNSTDGNIAYFRNDIKSFIPKGNVAFDYITIKRADGNTSEDWSFPNGGSITFGENCAYEHGYRADRNENLRIYIGSYYVANGGTVNLSAPDVEYERVASLGGYINGTSSSFTTSGDVTINLNAGKVNGAYGGMFNSASGSATLNGDVTFNFRGAEMLGNMSLGSYKSGIVNGNIIFNVESGISNKAYFGSMLALTDNITSYGNMALVVDADKVAESGKALSLTVSDGYYPTNIGKRFLIINNAEDLGTNTVTVDAKALQYYLSVKGGKLIPVFAESAGGNIGAFLGFEAVSDAEGYVPSFNGLALITNDNGYYTLSEGNVMREIVFADKATLSSSVILKSGLPGQADVVVPLDNGVSYTLPACSFTAEEGYIFAGWENDGTPYYEGDTVTINGDVTFTAQYVPANEQSYFFVSENGSDDGDGVSLATAYRTVAAAVSAAQSKDCISATLCLDGEFIYDAPAHTKPVLYKNGAFTEEVIISGDSIFYGIAFDSDISTNGSSVAFLGDISTDGNLIIGNENVATSGNAAALFAGEFDKVVMTDCTDTELYLVGASVGTLDFADSEAENLVIIYSDGSVAGVNTENANLSGKVTLVLDGKNLELAAEDFPGAELAVLDNAAGISIEVFPDGTVMSSDNEYIYAISDDDLYYSVDGTLTLGEGFFKLYTTNGEGEDYLPYPQAPDGKYFQSWQKVEEGHLKPVYTTQKTINPYYVSENGDDTNAGTSEESPFKTLTAAVNAIGKNADGKIYIMDTVYWSETHSLCNVPNYSGHITFEGLSADNVANQIIDYSRQSVVNGETAGFWLKGDATFKNISFRAHQWKGFYTYGYDLRFEGKIGYIPGYIGNPSFEITAGGYYSSVSSSNIYLGADCKVDSVALGQNNYCTISGKTTLTIDGATVGAVALGGKGADLGDVEVLFVRGSLGSLYTDAANIDTEITGNFTFLKGDGLSIDLDNRANVAIGGKTITYECEKGVIIRPTDKAELYEVLSGNTVVAKNTETGDEYISSKGGYIGMPVGSYEIKAAPVDYYTNDGETIEIINDTSFDFGKYLYRTDKENLVFTGWYFEGTDEAPQINEIIPAGSKLVARYEEYDPSGDELGIVGVQLRQADTEVSQALRFIFNKGKSFDEKFDVEEFGAVVIPRHLLGSNDLVIDGSYDYVGNTVTSGHAPAEKIYKRNADGVWYTLCVTGITPKNYGRLYTTRAYAKCTTANGIEYTLYSDTCFSGLMNIVRNNSDVSQGEKELFDEIKNAYYNSYFGNGVTAFSTSVYDRAYRVNSTGVGVRELTVNSNKPDTEPVKIAVLTDAHINSSKPLHAVSIENAMKCADFADEIVLLGDNVEAASSDLDMGELQRIVWDRYPRTLATLGNHEYFYPGNAGMDAVKQRVDELWPHDPDYYSKLVGDKVLLVLADDARQPEFGVSNYYFTEDKCEKLEADIAYARENGYIILFVHHVIFTSLDRTYMANGRMYDIITSNADVIKACLSGHSHGDSKQNVSATYKDENGNKVSTTIPCYTLQACSEPDERGNLLFVTVE